MKKILVVLGMLVALPVFAQGWQEINSKKYISIEKYDEANSYVFYWVKSLNDGSFDKINGQRIYYDMSYFISDCSNNKIATISTVAYGMKHNVLDRWSESALAIKNNIFDFEPVIPESYGETYSNFACGSYKKPNKMNVESKQEVPISNVSQPLLTYSIGSTKKEVLNIQGQPTSMDEYAWYYGNSRVDFNNGKVSGYKNRDNNLKIKVIY